MENEIIESVPLFSGKLYGIIVSANGSKRIIYDGVEVDPLAIVLTDLEQAEVDSAVYMAPLPPRVPRSVTMRQARLALLAAGLLPSVTAAIESLTSPQKEAAQIEWEYSQEVERTKEFVLLLGAALGLDAQALDALFLAAEVL